MSDQNTRAAQMQAYKRTVASRYRTLIESELSELPPGAYHVSPKVDGQLWFIDCTDGEVNLRARNGRILESAPVLDELRKTIGSGLNDTLIAGELFALGGSGRPRVGDISAALGSDGDSKRIGFLAFDLVVDEGATPEAEYATRLEKLESILSGGKRGKTIKTMSVSKGEVQGLYDELVASGKAEGLVARAADGRIYKIKPALHLDCVVIGYTQRQEDPKQARSVLLGLERPDGTIQLIGSCGNLGTDSDREALLSRLKPLVIESRFRKVSSSGALYKLCSPETVMEIIVSDVQTEDSKGAAIRQWALTCDGDAGWRGVAPVAGATIIHPRMARIREDKEAKGVDIRMAQLDDRCLTPGVDEEAVAVELPKSEVLRREVYWKAKKDLRMVRKLLVWQTNKSEVDPNFPAYVIHFTDYSPTRKKSIKREVRCAPTETIAMEIANEMIADNIKRGWKPA